MQARAPHSGHSEVFQQKDLYYLYLTMGENGLTRNDPEKGINGC